mmetsp:Transcript_22882/g.71999  ORF Transcript_22882/g.71999 Transcript_22882/m.71999 type:complete len:302 (-) Transcript_22882:193-1098(-)
MAPTAGPGGGEKAVKRSCLRKQLRKTKMCQHFERGECHFGADCAFAHAPEEVQSAPDLRKTRICTAFVEGKCDDKDCSFAHGEAELRSTDLFFKKTLCIWNEKGKCRAGEQCRFAHGQAELRAPPTGEDSVPSAGSRGHPGSCAAPCKYHWKKRGCKDGATCGRCHLCPWRPGSSSHGRGSLKRSASEDSRQPGDTRKRRRTGAARLDEHGNSRPSWLDEERGSHRHAAIWEPWMPASVALPNYRLHYGAPPSIPPQPPLAWGYPPAGSYMPGLPAAGYPVAHGWPPQGIGMAYPGMYVST